MNRLSGDIELRICFDGRWLGAHGIGRYAQELVKRFSQCDCVTGGVKPTNPLDVLFFTLRVLLNRCDLWFSPGYNAPLFGLSRYIFTIHDLNHLECAEASSFLKKMYYYTVIKRACRRAARVLTVSEYSRRKIIEWAKISPEQIVNVGNGVDSLFNPHGKRYAPGFRYLLCVSNRKPHKNEKRVIEAFYRADIPSDIHLLFTGEKTRDLKSLTERLGDPDRVLFAGEVPDGDLPAYYRGALALVFPSLYEGFGLPVLEAMASGTPVITSNVTALPEIAGDAALMVDPLSVQEIGEGIERICVDEVLRGELIKRGLSRAAKFQWDGVAEKVKAVLRDFEQGRCG